MIATDIIRLEGTPAQVGAAYGQATAACIRRYLADFLTNVEVEGIGIDEIRRRTDHYLRTVDVLAPWWQEDMAATAAAAGVRADDYAAYVAQKYVIRTTRPPSPPPAPHECTSFVSVGRASAGGVSLLHKNRDSAIRAQGVWIRQDAGCHRYLGGGDSGDHGLIHFVNEQGLAGAMNAGSANDDAVPDGWPTPQILRLVAEQAADCREALEIVRDIHRRGWYTNGTRGSIWLFVDRERALIVENTRHDLDATWIEDRIVARANDFLLPGTRHWAAPDAETSPRYRSARDGAAALDGRATPGRLLALARDETTEPRAMCSESTLSGFGAFVGHGPLGALVTVGNPASGIATPFYAEAAGVPAFVVDGSLWAATERRRQARAAGADTVPGAPAVERAITEEDAALRERVAGLPRDERAAALTDATAGWAARAYQALFS